MEKMIGLVMDFCGYSLVVVLTVFGNDRKNRAYELYFIKNSLSVLYTVQNKNQVLRVK